MIMIQSVTDLAGVVTFTLPRFGDDRGYFSETFNQRNILTHLGVRDLFVQDNESYTKSKGTIRGIHFQNRPMEQAKIVRCTQGMIMDYVVDLRKESKTFKKWVGVVLSPEINNYIFIPRGFGHAFVSLTDDVIIQYKVSQYYDKEHDRSIRWDDHEIGIDWPFKNPILSDKDRNAPLLCESDFNL